MITPVTTPTEEVTQPAPTIGASVSLRSLAANVLRSFRDIVVRTAEIAALESRAAGIALTRMAAAAVAAILLVVTTWGLLVAAGVYALIAAGLTPVTALLLAALANFLVGALLVALIPRLARRLTFPATRRVLEKLGPQR